MSTLQTWAARWAIPQPALAELQANLLGLDGGAPVPEAGLSEAAVQSRVRVVASQMGMRLWRNNVGAFHDAAAGVHVRFGLANDSKQVNEVIKSGDLIGIRPRLIGPADVGRTIGQFVSFECKRGDWRWTASDREVAQQNWAALVVSLGGHAQFINDARQLQLP